MVLVLLLSTPAGSQSTLPPPELTVTPPKISEEDMRSRVAKEVNLTLGGGGWAAPLGVDLDATADWLARAVGRGTTLQPHGWAGAVLPYLLPEHVVRTSRSILTLRLLGIDGGGWYPAFDVRYTEAVSVGAP